MAFKRIMKLLRRYASGDVLARLDIIDRQIRALSAFHKSASEAQIRELLSQPRYANHQRLEHYGFKVFSQHGEDGILQEIFRRIGTTNKRFVEFGVNDGLECNTHFLIYSGWRGLWIESNALAAAKIRGLFGQPLQDGSLKVEQSFITVENFNEIIARAQCSGEIDLLSIDIDGNDYYVCQAITAVMPRVIVAEYNASFPPPIEWIKPYEPAYVWDGSLYFGASLAAYAYMLARKGFTLVGTDLCGVNAFFVRTDILGDCFTGAGDVPILYNPPRYSLGEGYPSGHPPVFTNFTIGGVAS
jgi:hypothetical protein